MLPLSVDVPMKRLPWANWGLIVATVAISLAVPYSKGEGPLGQVTYSPLVLQRQDFAVHQLVTSLFQHADWLHLFGNMLFLFVFGNAINAKLGHLSFLAAYLGIGALDNVIWLVVGKESACLGASGAIMGLCGMFLILYPTNDVRLFWDSEFEIALITRSLTAELPGWGVVLLFLTFDIWGIFARNTGIGHLSHIIGLLLGASLAITLLLTGWLTPDRGELTLLQWLGINGSLDSDAPARIRGRRKSTRSEPPKEKHI